jgi:hypothetical protein
MADTKKYTVVHPVRHDGKLYDRGAEISLGEKDATRLLDRGVISTGKPTVVQVVQVVAGPSTAETLASLNKLNAMTKEALVEYAQTTYGLQLPSDDRKEALVTAIHEKYVAAYAPAAV